MTMKDFIRRFVLWLWKIVDSFYLLLPQFWGSSCVWGEGVNVDIETKTVWKPQANVFYFISQLQSLLWLWFILLLLPLLKLQNKSWTPNGNRRLWVLSLLKRKSICSTFTNDNPSPCSINISFFTPFLLCFKEQQKENCYLINF